LFCTVVLGLGTPTPLFSLRGLRAATQFLCACCAPCPAHKWKDWVGQNRSQGGRRNSLEKTQPSWLPQIPLKLHLRNTMITAPPHNLTKPRSDTTTLCTQRLLASAICLAPPQYGLKASDFRFPLLFLRLCGLLRFHLCCFYLLDSCFGFYLRLFHAYSC
jgi:hypothetical protein